MSEGDILSFNNNSFYLYSAISRAFIAFNLRHIPGIQEIRHISVYKYINDL